MCVVAFSMPHEGGKHESSAVCKADDPSSSHMILGKLRLDFVVGFGYGLDWLLAGGVLIGNGALIRLVLHPMIADGLALHDKVLVDGIDHVAVFFVDAVHSKFSAPFWFRVALSQMLFSSPVGWDEARVA